MYNYYQQQNSAIAPKMNYGGFLKGHPVSSLEEVRALSVDFDGSIFYFPDIANKRIYTKQVNMDGTATVNMYELTPIPAPPTPQEYVTKDEFQQAIQALTAQISPAKENPFEVPKYKVVQTSTEF